MWQLEEGNSLGISSGMVLLLHDSQGLGAVKALTISWALLGVKDAQDLVGTLLWAGRSSPVYALQLCVCVQHTPLALGFQSLPCARVRNPLTFPWTWFVSPLSQRCLPLTQMSLLLPQCFCKMRTIFSVSC